MASSVKAAEALPALLGSFANQVGASLAIDPQAKRINIKGQTVVVPSIDKFCQNVGESHLYDMAVGCVIHAAAKIRFTDANNTSAWLDSYKGHEHQDLSVKVHTIVEDAFLRAKVAAEMPHLSTACQPMWDLVEKEHTNAIAKRDDHDTDIIADLVFQASRYAASPNPTNAAMLQQITPRAQAIAGDAEVLEVRKLIAASRLLVDSEAVLSLSTQLLAILGIEPSQKQPDTAQQDAPKAPPKQQMQEVGESDEGEADGAPGQGGKSSGSADATPHGEDSGSDEQLQTAPGECQDQETSADEADDNSADEGQEPQVEYSPFDLFESMATSEVSEPERPEAQGPMAVAAGAGSDLAANDRFIRSCGRELYDRVVSSSMMESARLATSLQAFKQTRVTYGRSGKLVAARAWKLKAGSINIFRKEEEGQQLSTAVQILLDRSGSMSGGLGTALEATLFMPLALNSVDGVQTSIDIFPGRYSAVENVKGWGERLMSKLDMIASVRADGGTPMTKALQATAQSLMEVNADRKILLVITDGDPDDGPHPSSKVVESLTRSGVEVIGIGIGRPRHLASIFSESVHIRHVGELTGALVSIFDRCLLQQAA